VQRNFEALQRTDGVARLKHQLGELLKRAFLLEDTGRLEEADAIWAAAERVTIQLDAVRATESEEEAT
jgi:hypothetical protein